MQASLPHVLGCYLTHRRLFSQLSTEQTAQLGAELFIVKVRFSSVLLSALTNLPKKANFQSKYTPPLPAATAPHRASEGYSGHGGRHPQIYTERTLEPHR